MKPKIQPKETTEAADTADTEEAAADETAEEEAE